MDHKELYIGLMSGTSVDGIDAALVSLANQKINLISHCYLPYTPAIRRDILALCEKGNNEIERLGDLDRRLGFHFAEAVNALLKQENLTHAAIKAIGSHGQTIRHAPHHKTSFTLQIGDPNTIAAHTGITTVADFRRKDIAFGGQGAPLVPAFHQYMLPAGDKVIVNIGGIANITLISKTNNHVVGFDSGPGNVLMDAWIDQHQQKNYDDAGKWASSGSVDNALLQLFLKDPYFATPAPKSTGREYFNLNWLNQIYQSYGNKINAQDMQATLVALTAESIIKAIALHVSSGEILICGGGASNQTLMTHLQTLAGEKYNVATTNKYGIHPDWVEAMAFAWLAFRTLNKLPGNLKTVTGAKQETILGAIYYA